MTGGARRDDETLPIFDAVEPVEAGAVLRAAGRRRSGQARGAGAAAALLVILVGGIVVGNLEKEGEARPSATAGIHVVAGPTDSGGPCRAQVAEHYPNLSMSVTGVPYAVEALLATGYHSGQEVIVAPTWLVPPLARALYVQPQDTFDVHTGESACIRSITVSYKPTADLTPGPGGDGLFQEIYQPPVQSVTFEGIPLGDWVLRTEAHYAMQGDDPGAEIVTLSYFRIIAGGAPVVTDSPRITPVPTPEATPTVPCGSLEPTTATDVFVLAGNRDPVPGIADVIPLPPLVPADVPLVEANIGDLVRLLIDGEACAVSWDIELLDAETGVGGNAYFETNPRADPAVASENRWQLAIDGDQIVIARLHFANGVTLIRSWRVTVRPFQLPSAHLVAKDGTTFEAVAGCGLTVELANGYSAGDDCGSIGYSPDPTALHVTAYEPVTFEIPGWGISSWSARCGSVVSENGTDSFDDSRGCALGGAATPANDALPTPVTFVLPAGDTVVRIDIAAVAPSGDRFSVTFYAHVIAA